MNLKEIHAQLESKLIELCKEMKVSESSENTIKLAHKINAAIAIQTAIIEYIKLEEQ